MKFSRPTLLRQEWDLAGFTDSSTFAQCIDAPDIQDRIDRDIALGQRIGVRGTPTLVGHGIVSGDPGDAELMRLAR